MAHLAPALKKFEEHLGGKGLKMTHERKCILEKISTLNKHFDADSLYESLKKDKVRVARGTVYRTLPLLLESGVLQMSVGDGHRDYYERKDVKGHHDHMYCIECHKIIEFHNEELEALQERICKKFQFKPLFHDHRIYGHCGNCGGK